MYFFEMGYAADSMAHFSFFVGKRFGIGCENLCKSGEKSIFESCMTEL